MNRAVLPEDQRQDVLGDLHWAVMSAWKGKAAASHKLAVRDAVARHLGWDNLRADTDQRERKFNGGFSTAPPERGGPQGGAKRGSFIRSVTPSGVHRQA